MPADSSRMRLPHILYFSTLRNWLRLLWRYGREIDADQRLRALRITLFVIATIPVRLIERLLFGVAVARHRLSQPPVFIVGHWRSGTTNLHNLLLQDPQFASVTMLHCAIPSGFLSWGWLARWILKRRLPSSRPMDAVPLGIDEPMSEDFALAGLTHMSHYLSYFFPRLAEPIFRRTILFEDVSSEDRGHWLRMFDFLLRKVSWASGGRRLLLKNPANLGRIPELIRRYPEARFIHVCRNPWTVHASSMKLMDRFTENLAFQSHSAEQAETFVSRRYRLIMERWFRDQKLIPPGQLIEVRHEEVTADPMGVVARIYRKLGLGDWENMQPRLKVYTDSLHGYRNNQYKFSRDYLDRISPDLRPAAERLEYTAPTPDE